MGCQFSSVDDDRDMAIVGRSSHNSFSAPLKKDRYRSISGHTTREKKYQPEKNNDNEPPELDKNGHLIPNEVEKRIVRMLSSKINQIGNVTIRHAASSQRGFYPEDVHKPNQDSYSIDNKFSGACDNSFFAVYDGHGDDGHTCARFAKKKLPMLMTKYMRQLRISEAQNLARNKGEKFVWKPDDWPDLNKQQCEEISERAHLKCNEEIHDSDGVLDAFSGTTSCSALFHSGRIMISNVGDSRAILGKKVEGSAIPQAPSTPLPLRAIPLSRDQTPIRRDELERVKECGARVMTFDQLTGDTPIDEDWVEENDQGENINLEGTMPRLWFKDAQNPGTAFTRSIGDSRGEKIGVIAEPECISVEITKDDRILVIASDGVFEFLTNQEVIDICAKFDDPCHACEDILAASYKKWLQYENRTDDITVIVIYLDKKE